MRLEMRVDFGVTLTPGGPWDSARFCRFLQGFSVFLVAAALVFGPRLSVLGGGRYLDIRVGGAGRGSRRSLPVAGPADNRSYRSLTVAAPAARGSHYF